MKVDNDINKFFFKLYGMVLSLTVPTHSFITSAFTVSLTSIKYIPTYIKADLIPRGVGKDQGFPLATILTYHLASLTLYIKKCFFL